MNTKTREIAAIVHSVSKMFVTIAGAWLMWDAAVEKDPYMMAFGFVAFVYGLVVEVDGGQKRD